MGNNYPTQQMSLIFYTQQGYTSEKLSNIEAVVQKCSVKIVVVEISQT